MGITELFLRPSLDDVIRDHGPRVHSLLRRMFGATPDVVDDVFQNVFVEVMRSLPRFQGRAKLSTWIHRVALNVAYQEMRQQYGRTRLTPFSLESRAPHHHGARATRGDDDDGGTADADPRADVEGNALRADAARRVHAALSSLPPKQRIAVTLHDLEGLTLKEIADDLGLPLQTVASRVRLGRAHLADALAELRGTAVAVRENPDESEISGAHFFGVKRAGSTGRSIK